MVDSISTAAQDRAQDTLDGTITLAQGFPSLRCERSRRPTRPGSPPCIHAEYGMTELLSQAYSKSDGLFESVPWMRILVRNDDDPFEVHEAGEGIINIIDLSNIYSCSFIATDDLGKVSADGRFEVFGRTDNSDIRGCSLLLV